MHKDWFPFFSMLFWCLTKVAGLALVITGWQSLATLLATNRADLPGMSVVVKSLGVAALVPLILGCILLFTDVVHDLATAQQRRRRPDAS